MITTVAIAITEIREASIHKAKIEKALSVKAMTGRVKLGKVRLVPRCGSVLIFKIGSDLLCTTTTAISTELGDACLVCREKMGAGHQTNFATTAWASV